MVETVDAHAVPSPARTRATVVGCQRPPRLAGTPSALRVAAIARMEWPSRWSRRMRRAMACSAWSGVSSLSTGW
jgi:hypothetical protein